MDKWNYIHWKLLRRQKCGYGIFTWPDGGSYEGGWENGKQQGEGIQTSPEKTTRKGYWIEGKRVSWIE